MTHDPLRRTKDYLERVAQRTYKTATPTIFGNMYYWVFGFTKGGKTVVLGPYYSTQEADRELSTLDDGEVFELETRSTARATRAIKFELIARGGDPDESLRRVLHQKGLERESKKKEVR